MVRGHGLGDVDLHYTNDQPHEDRPVFHTEQLSLTRIQSNTVTQEPAIG